LFLHNYAGLLILIEHAILLSNLQATQQYIESSSRKIRWLLFQENVRRNPATRWTFRARTRYSSHHAWVLHAVPIEETSTDVGEGVLLAMIITRFLTQSSNVRQLNHCMMQCKSGSFVKSSFYGQSAARPMRLATFRMAGTRARRAAAPRLPSHHYSITHPLCSVQNGSVKFMFLGLP
jgi:hypothetical protein